MTYAFDTLGCKMTGVREDCSFLIHAGMDIYLHKSLAKNLSISMVQLSKFVVFLYYKVNVPFEQHEVFYVFISNNGLPLKET